jgi:hypothetical protein
MSETDGVWLTKAEIARVRGITIASAYRLIRRQGWRRQPGNDGKIRVLVPSDWANGHGRGEPAVPSTGPLTRPSDAPSDQPSDIPSDVGGFVRLIEAANVRADEASRRADAADRRADAALALVTDANARADRAEARADVAEKAADQARTEAQQAQEAARAAEEQAEALRLAEADRKARGRLRRAWDGWRGR